MIINFINFQTKEILLEKHGVNSFLPRIGECFKLNGSSVRIIDIEYIISKSTTFEYEQINFLVEIYNVEKK